MKNIFFILHLDFSLSHMDHYSYTAHVHPHWGQDGVSNVLWYNSWCHVYHDSEDSKCTSFCILLESLIIQWKQLEGPGDYSEMSYSEQTYPAWNHGISSALIIKKHMDEHRGGEKAKYIKCSKNVCFNELVNIARMMKHRYLPRGLSSTIKCSGD